MVARMKLIGAIMATLFAIGFQAQAGVPSLHLMCKRLDALLSSTPGRAQMNTEELISIAELHISSSNKFMAELVKAWRAVVGSSDCGQSSLQNVMTIADCSPGSGFGILHIATREYARKCLGPEFWKDRIAAKSQSRACSLTGCFGVEDLNRFINGQYLLDYKKELKKCKKAGMTNDYCTSSAIQVGVAKAVSGDLNENIKKLKTLDDVHAYLEKSLYKPCSNLNLSAIEDTIDEMVDLKEYLGVYEKFLLSLDESAQEDVARYFVCRAIKNSGKNRTSALIKSALEALQLIPTAEKSSFKTSHALK